MCWLWEGTLVSFGGFCFLFLDESNDKGKQRETEHGIEQRIEHEIEQGCVLFYPTSSLYILLLLMSSLGGHASHINLLPIRVFSCMRHNFIVSSWEYRRKEDMVFSHLSFTLFTYHLSFYHPHHRPHSHYHKHELKPPSSYIPFSWLHVLWPQRFVSIYLLLFPLINVFLMSASPQQDMHATPWAQLV